jgi:hypothetical protein
MYCIFRELKNKLQRPDLFNLEGGKKRIPVKSGLDGWKNGWIHTDEHQKRIKIAIIL